MLKTNYYASHLGVGLIVRRLTDELNQEVEVNIEEATVWSHLLHTSAMNAHNWDVYRLDTRG